MSTESLLNSLLVSDSNSLGLLDVALALVIPFLLSFITASLYRYTQRNNNYSTTFVHSLFLFSSLTSIITLIIGSNIARAFGLVGALSIIRFRNALKSPIDAVYIFWSLAIGMACGTGFYFAGLLLTLFCGGFVLILHVTRFGEAKHTDSILKVVTTSDEEPQVIPEVEKTLKGTAWGFRRINILFNSEEKEKTYVYLLRTRNSENIQSIGDRVRSLTGVLKVFQLNSEASLYLH